MNPLNRQTLLGLSEMTVLPPADIDFDSLTKEDLLSELRALQIVLARMQKLLDASRQRDAIFEQLERAYQASLAACSREEARSAELQRQIDLCRSAGH